MFVFISLVKIRCLRKLFIGRIDGIHFLQLKAPSHISCLFIGQCKLKVYTRREGRKRNPQKNKSTSRTLLFNMPGGIEKLSKYEPGHEIKN